MRQTIRLCMERPLRDWGIGGLEELLLITYEQINSLVLTNSRTAIFN